MGMGVNMNDAAVDDDGGGSESIVAEINITPLTDVFLVLLIIFMVTSTAMVETEKASRSGVKVSLPKSQSAGPVTKRRTDPVLTITKANEIYLFNKKIAPENLEAELRQAFASVESDVLLIRGDKNVALGSAVDLMSIAKRAGAAHINILTETAEK
ncbi:MAG: biopolymer transporter ExbD [Myxococcales bacterium]|nr:biopolymer transporter ExbD [Myxococcales bacterium]